MSKGQELPLEEIPEAKRVDDVDWMLERGNHKSAEKPENAKDLQKMNNREVQHRWMLPVTVECVKKIKGAGVIPIGVAEQYTMDENGNRMKKKRTTHNALFEPPLKMSINNRLLRDLLTPCFYGHCLLRILHIVHIMRWTNPSKGIFITKLDMDSGYRRLHTAAKISSIDNNGDCKDRLHFVATPIWSRKWAE